MPDASTMLPQLIGRRAAEDPDRVFIEEVDGGALTYGELHTSALRWAGAYRRAGVRHGDRVLTMLPLNLVFYCSTIGLAWVGGIEAPINTDYRGPLLLHAVRTAEPTVIVTHADNLPHLTALAEELGELDPLIVVLGATDAPAVPGGRVVTVDDFLDGAEPPADLEGPQPWDVASIMYTSGTTGPSKGVLMPWGQLYQIATKPYPFDDFTPDDAYYLPSVTYHMSAKGCAFTMALVNGRLVIRERFSLRGFFPEVEKYRCTIANMIGAAAQVLHSAAQGPDDASTPLRYVMMSPVLGDVERFMSRFGLTVTTAYGMTETGPVIRSAAGTVSDRTYRTCGQLTPGYEVKVVDDHDREVAPGQTGELIVRAHEPWVLNLGYFGMPAESMTAWRNGWFHTGDGFTLDEEGNFYFVDRLKDSIRRRGENISSFEVEAMVNSHADVMESAAVAVPSELGEDDVKIVVVRQEGSGLTEPVLIAHCAELMPRFMVPRYVEFVERLPKTPTARTQKATLRAEGITPGTWCRDQHEAGARV